jgi:hypothetical protein
MFASASPPRMASLTRSYADLLTMIPLRSSVCRFVPWRAVPDYSSPQCTIGHVPGW